MPNATFRIESVSIEGFKAFTTRQEFSFDGRNVFLFGPNGLGKTSIVEAIRWCLFGLASRPGEIVNNQFYGGPCYVQIALRSDDGIWTLHRRFRPSSDRSPLTVRDPNRTERNLEDVFPQLSRIGPREGTHVIYAAQQPSSRRPEADITDFSYVVYRYLGLEEVPRLSDVLLALSTDWETQEVAVCSEVENLGQSFSEKIEDIDESLSRITSDPPWGTALTPNSADTRARVDQLAGDAERLGAQCSRDALADLVLRDRVYEIETAVSAFFSGEMTGIREAVAEVDGRLREAQGLLEEAESTAQQIAVQSQAAESHKQELATALDGDQIAVLQADLQGLESDLKSAQLKSDVVRASLKYLAAIGDDSEHEACPACGTEFQLGRLKSQLEVLETSGDCKTSEILEQRDNLRDLIYTATRLSNRLEALEAQVTVHEKELTETLDRAKGAFDLPSQSTMKSLRDYVAETQRDLQELNSALKSQSEASIAWNRRIGNTRREVQFHDLRYRKQRLQNLHDTRYEALHDSLKDLGELRDIADKTRELINAHLQERLREDLPPVAKEMTDVYLRLTGSPTFDSIHIQQGEDPNGRMTLDLRVSSSRGPGSWSVEQGILNGQALNAIQLVPYFVFSRYQDSPLLDLLLLDDPTQAFDTNKIQLLLTELSDAASHATLFVATHEETRFLPALKGFFGADRVKAYRAVGINEDGPQFEDVPIDL